MLGIKAFNISQALSTIPARIKREFNSHVRVIRLVFLQLRNYWLNTLFRYAVRATQ